MPEREVERVEVVRRRLHLAAVDDRVAETEEDVLDLPPDLRDQVEVPAADMRARHGDVDPLVGEPPVELGPLQRLLTGVDGTLELLAQRVERHARLAVAHLAEGELELALAPEKVDSNLFDLADRRSRVRGCECVVLESLGVHGSAEVTNAPSPA